MGAPGVLRPIRRAGATVAMVLALAGCRGDFPMPSADDLQTWSRVPLAPNPALDQRALAELACRGGADGELPLTIALQDRRTASTAAFLVTGPGHFGGCLISEGAGGGGSTDVVPVLTGEITVDEQSSGTVGAASAKTLGGLAAARVTSVRVELDDGTQVMASVGNGFWLSWWPLAAAATRVSAIDASGAIVAVLEPGEDGWLPLGANP